MDPSKRKQVREVAKMFTAKKLTRLLILAAAGSSMLLAGASSVAAQSGNKEPGVAQRTSITTSYSQADGKSSAAARTSEDTFQPLGSGNSRALPGTSSMRKGTAETSVQSRHINQEFWIYSAQVNLFFDDDRDGYYHGIELVFDADTYYVAADVYAVVYLSLEGGPWNEYAATDIFTLLGASGLDDYVLETELLAGYPTGDYDLMIELYDAWSDELVAVLGPEESPALGFLALEDADRDIYYPTHSVTVSHGGGGALGGWTLALLLLAGLASRRDPQL